MEKDGDKPKGRFLKKGSPAYKLVDVQKFNFTEISKTKITYPDNPNSNIVYARLHDKKELAESIKPPSWILDNLLDPEYRMPIILPRDFTEDWIEEKNKAKRRSAFDEEEFDDETLMNPIPAPPEEEDEHSSEQHGGIEHKTAEKDIERDALKDLQAPQKQVVNQATSTHDPVIIINHSTPSISPPSSAPETEIHSMKETPQQDNSGYEDGYKEGFKTAEAEVEKKISENFGKLFSNFTEMTEKFSVLKKEILTSSQSNFIDLAKALCEALIEREVHLHPETFAGLIEKAIAQTVSNDEFTVFVHPKSFEKLQALNLKQLKDRLKEDPDIEEDTFRIQSSLGTVNSGVKKIVEQLLSQADLSLFVPPDENSKIE